MLLIFANYRPKFITQLYKF